MELVLDNNILFSLINPHSVNSYLFSLLKVKFSAPEFIKSELEKYKLDCLVKSKLSEHEFELRWKEIEEKIKFFKFSEYKRFIKKAIDSLFDSDDSPYIALALFINAPIWSNDSHLKQQPLVKIYTTKELIDKMLKDEF